MSKTIAIIGASTDRRKYGNKAVRAFRDGGWTVYPINPTETEIEGIKTYSSIAEVPEPLERVSMYVPPRVGMRLLDAIVAKHPQEVFFNPGADSPEIIEEARQKGINAVVACSIVDIGRRPSMYPDE